MSKIEAESMYPIFINLMSQCEFDISRPDLPCTYCAKRKLEKPCIKQRASLLPLPRLFKDKVSESSSEELSPILPTLSRDAWEPVNLHQASYRTATIFPGEFNIKNLEGMFSKTPKDPDALRLLVFSYFKELDPLGAVVKLFLLASQYPANSRLQEYTELAMSPDPFFLFVELDINPISEWPIISAKDENTFNEALGGDGKYDFGIDMWWKLLAQHPFRMGLLRRFRNAVYHKHPSQEKKGLLSFLHFILRCLLLGLSKRAVSYGIYHIDWWPFANEKDIATLRPYMVEYKWHSVPSFSDEYTNCKDLTGLSGQDWVDSSRFQRSHPAAEEDIRAANIEAPASHAATGTQHQVATDSVRRKPWPFKLFSGASGSPVNAGDNELALPKYIPMFTCFQNRLYHTKINIESETNYHDRDTFITLRAKYFKKLGRLGKWRNYLLLRRLKAVEPLLVYSLVNFELTVKDRCRQRCKRPRGSSRIDGERA
jgi:hypothetical protein